MVSLRLLAGSSLLLPLLLEAVEVRLASVGLVPISRSETGIISSLKAGMAAAAGRLLKEIKTLTARGVSGKRLVISVCNSAPQLCPIPITGRGPNSTRKDHYSIRNRIEPIW